MDPLDKDPLDYVSPSRRKKKILYTALAVIGAFFIGIIVLDAIDDFNGPHIENTPTYAD